MDSMDLEREKGITILAKNTAVRVRGDVKINIVDTPGPRRLRRRGRAGAVDGRRRAAARRRLGGPAPPDPLRAAQDARGQAAGDPRDQQGRPARRPHRRGRPRRRGAVPRPRRRRRPARLPDRLLRVPGGQGVARAAGRRRRAARRRPRAAPADGPAARAHPGARVRPRRCRCRRSSPTSTPRPYVGRLALCRVRSGTLRKGRPVAWCRADGTIERARIAELYITDALDRVPADEAGPGEIVAVAGIPEITIGETLADPDDPRPLPVIHIDDPSLSMTIGINTSPLAGQEGTSLTARLVKNRLDAELVGNVSIRVLPTERPDTWEVQGRGELQLAVLVEMMRREGFELTVGKPQVLTREIDGVVHEPVDRAHRRRARGVHGRDHPAARPAQGADGADRQPRHRLGAPRLPRAGARADRVPHRAAHRDPGHGAAAPRVRVLRAVGRHDPRPHPWLARRRPARPDDGLLADVAAGARASCSSVPAPRCTRA